MLEAIARGIHGNAATAQSSWWFRLHGHTLNSLRIHPAASPCGHWDTQRRILKIKGISQQAKNVSVEVSGWRTGGCRI